ncbi:MAG: DUF4157 domain-containing protein [Phycisphaerales bacterium]|nr:MAG: DUF4157 domain-containing protein [Phycisphaerales bacterium]
MRTHSTCFVQKRLSAESVSSHGILHRQYSAKLRSDSAISQPGDRLEQEADRMAGFVVSQTPNMSSPDVSNIVSSLPQCQRAEGKQKPEEEKYKEAAKKAGEAFVKTPVGKRITDKAKKLGEDFISTLPGKVITGAVAAGAVTAIVAENAELPFQPPAIPLDMIAPDLKMKITYEGPTRNPSKAMISFSGKFGRPKQRSSGKPAPTKAELQRRKNIRKQREIAEFQESLKSPEEKAREEEFMHWQISQQTKDPTSPLYIPGMKSETDIAAEKYVKEYEESQLQRKGASGALSMHGVPPVVHEVLSSPGRSLEAPTRGFMESRFGHDFSKVRIHTDARSAESVQAVRARAYTVGNDVVFGTGQYSPQSPEGKRLLAHELTHVVQHASSRDRISLWGDKDHKKITYKAARKIIPDGMFRYHLASASTLMDYKTGRLLWTGPGFLLGFTKGEGPEHGEDGNYSNSSESAASAENKRVQKSYLNLAVKYDKEYDRLRLKGEPIRKLGKIARKMFHALGDACHIAQDRGSHGEGVKGKGHDDPRTKDDWDPDNSVDNSEGYEKAIANTTELLTDWEKARSKAE